MEVIRGGQGISVKKYVVKLSAEEREQLEAMICAGKHPAQSLTKARIAEADVSEAGEGWSDSAISAALDTSINNIGRTRRRLVEEGIAAALTRKYNPNSARPRIFDGAAEAKCRRLVPKHCAHTQIEDWDPTRSAHKVSRFGRFGLAHGALAHFNRGSQTTTPSPR